jgi:hypothetical protein
MVMSILEQNQNFFFGFCMGMLVLLFAEMIFGLIGLRIYNSWKRGDKVASKKLADRRDSQRLATQFNIGGRIANAIQGFIANERLNHQINVSQINNGDGGYHIMVAWTGTRSSSYSWGGADYYGIPLLQILVNLALNPQIKATSDEFGVFLSGASDEEAHTLVANAKKWILAFANNHQLART